jgi:hypothetical protein
VLRTRIRPGVISRSIVRADSSVIVREGAMRSPRSIALAVALVFQPSKQSVSIVFVCHRGFRHMPE